MSKLFEDSDTDDDLKTDNEYAKSYDKWRQKEELHKLKTKYVNINMSDSSESSSEDEEDEDVANVLEKDFLKTLSCLKKKDPIIYDQNTKFFEEEIGDKNKKTKKEKPLFINDYDRKVLLEGENGDNENSDIKREFTYVEEQEKLKENLQEALEAIDENEDSGMFKFKAKTENTHEENFKNWLCGDEDNLENKQDEEDLKPLKEFWTDPNLDEDEKFLRDYILNKRFLDSNADAQNNVDEELSEDETLLEKQEAFEHKYNFRFEDPDDEFIKRYPRTLQNSVRREDDKRKVKRTEVKERKKKEKAQKMEELKQLQFLKKKEIEEKIKKLQEITGNKDVGFKEEDIDGDFDPEAHDKRMQNLFNDDFYEGPEEDQKPEFPDLDEELEIENWDKWQGDSGEEPNNDDSEMHCEDEGFNMDCDYDPSSSNVQQELIEKSKGKKKRKRKSKFALLASEPKPVFDPKDKTFQQYLDEYYKFDCEDIIGDIPCKFKYREVIPNSFGLTVEEILLAKDKELNRWCSIKKAVQHRPEHVEKYDVIAYLKKSQNINLKKKILPSLFIEEQEDNETTQNKTDEDEPNEVQNKKGKKRKNKQNESSNEEEHSLNESGPRKKAKKIKSRDESEGTSSVNIMNETKNRNEEQTELVEEKNNTAEGFEAASINNKNNNIKRKKKKKNKKTKQKTTIGDTNKNIRCNKANITKSKKLQKRDQKKFDISNARLAAYGINKKKFKNKLMHKNNE